jgi:flagellar M-ring protein FliF
MSAPRTASAGAQDKAKAFAGKLWSDFKAFTPGQKAVTLAAVLALVVGGFLFSTWKSEPAYAPLYTSLDPADASAIIDKLNAAGTPYKLTSAGTEITVPKDKVYASRLTMSSAGLPGSGHSGYSLLDGESVTTSDFKQQVDYQRAVEGELAKTIQSIDGVQRADVHLAIPKNDVFNDDTQKPTASVLLTVSAATALTNQQVASVRYLVSSAVPSLAVNDVTISDSTGRVLAAPGEDAGGLDSTATQTQQTQAYATRQTAALQGLIDPLVGAGHSKVVYNPVFDFDKKSQTTEDYTYKPGTPPVNESHSEETYTGTQAQNNGTLGAGSPAPSQSATNNQGTYDKKNDVLNNALGKITQTTETAPGTLKTQYVSVLLDKNVPNLDITGIQAQVASALGLDTKRGDTIDVRAIAFDTTAEQQAAAEAAAAAAAAKAAAAKKQQQELIKQGVIGGVLLIAAIIAFVWFKRRKRGDEPPELEEPFFLDDPVPPAPPVQLEAEPNLELAEAAARRRALVALAEEQPDDVARVLSGWLSS